MERSERMTTPFQPEPVNPRFESALRLRDCWAWFLGLGIVLMLLGAGAVAYALLATLYAVLTFGILLLAGGVVQIVNAILARSWRGFFVHFLAGILHLLVGALIVEHPLRAAEDLTLMLALAFLVGGAFRIGVCLIERFAGWNWVLLNGLVTLLLGIAIWRRWPASTEWVIGTFVGIDLLFNGWSWVMLGLAVKGSAPGPLVPEKLRT